VEFCSVFLQPAWSRTLGKTFSAEAVRTEATVLIFSVSIVMVAACCPAATGNLLHRPKRASLPRCRTIPIRPRSVYTGSLAKLS